MPKRDSAAGKFISECYAIQLPSFFTLIQILVLSILLYPWYYILSRQNYLAMIFESIFFKNQGDNVTQSQIKKLY